MRRSIILVGMPGSGKSEVGSMLARERGDRFVDLDEEIARREGSDAASLIRERGEPVFRRAEAEVLREALSAAEPAVVATGGGAVLLEENRALMHGAGVVVWLDVPEDVLARRLAGDAVDRPLIADAADIGRLLIERAPIYAGIADVVVDGSEGPDVVVAAIIQHVGEGD